MGESRPQPPLYDLFRMAVDEEDVVQRLEEAVVARPLRSRLLPMFDGADTNAMLDYAHEHGYVIMKPETDGELVCDDLLTAFQSLIEEGWYQERPPYLGQRFSVQGKEAYKKIEYVKLMDHKPTIEMLKAWQKWFHIVKFGGDFALGTSGFEGQPEHQGSHSDWPSAIPQWHRGKHCFCCSSDSDPDVPEKHSRWVPPAVALSMVVHPISDTMSTLRQIAWNRVHEWDGSEEDFERLADVMSPLPKGARIFRDVRAVHSGTRNLDSTTRFLPGVLSISHKYFHKVTYHLHYMHPCMPWDFEEHEGAAKGHLDYLYQKF